MQETAFYRECLQRELARRCDSNPRYSLRAFARALEINPGALSRIMAGTRILSFKSAQKILKALDLTPQEQELFLTSLASGQSSRAYRKWKKDLASEGMSQSSKELSLDLFRVISDWYHYAILELTFVQGFKPDPRWIAKQLGISQAEAKLAVDRLLNLGLLEEKSGRITKSTDRITTSDKHLTTPALKKYQKQVLEKAIHSLENDPIEDRSMSSMTMAIDPARLALARQMIEEFADQVCKVLETGKQKRVYQLGVSLYPLQKDSEGK